MCDISHIQKPPASVCDPLQKEKKLLILEKNPEENKKFRYFIPSYF